MMTDVQHSVTKLIRFGVYRLELISAIWVYIESLALKIPSIFTKSGIGNEFLEHEKNCFIAKHKDHRSIYNGLIFFSNNQLIKANIVQEAYSNVINKYSIKKMLDKLDLVYFND